MDGPVLRVFVLELLRGNSGELKKEKISLILQGDFFFSTYRNLQIQKVLCMTEDNRCTLLVAAPCQMCTAGGQGFALIAWEGWVWCIPGAFQGPPNSILERVNNRELT